MKGKRKAKIREHGIYLLPNLFTIAALFAAFYAIIAAMKGYFDTSAIAIFIAMLMDGLDGRVARLTNTQTAFGAQLDSLCDMISFGMAPALVLYSWSLVHLGKIGWLVAFAYTVAVALRLARFNTQLGVADKSYFQGLASTMGAGVMAGTVWFLSDLAGAELAIPIAVLTITIAALMVSNIRYPSFKEWNAKKHVPFMTIVLLVLILVLVSIDPPRVLFSVFLIYALYGPFATLLQIHKRRKLRKKLRCVK